MQWPTLNLLCIWTWQDSKPVQSPFPYLIKVIAEQLLEPSKQKHCHQKQTHVHLCERELSKPFVFFHYYITARITHKTPFLLVRETEMLFCELLYSTAVCAFLLGSVSAWCFGSLFSKQRKLNITAFTTISTSLLYWIVSICKHYSKYTTCLSFSVNIRLVLHWKWEVCTT